MKPETLAIHSYAACPLHVSSVSHLVTATMLPTSWWRTCGHERTLQVNVQWRMFFRAEDGNDLRHGSVALYELRHKGGLMYWVLSVNTRTWNTTETKPRADYMTSLKICDPTTEKVILFNDEISSYYYFVLQLDSGHGPKLEYSLIGLHSSSRLVSETGSF
jgi:hypothetical protein